MSSNLFIYASNILLGNLAINLEETLVQSIHFNSGEKKINQ